MLLPVLIPLVLFGSEDFEPLDEVAEPRGLFDAPAEWWTENLRWTIDESGRAVFNTDTEVTGTVVAIGFDVHKVVSGHSGDIGTFVLQGYLTRIDDLARRPPFFEGDSDWEFVFRIFNFNYTAWTRGLVNLRIGHFEVPYGLEHILNTNGTLRDYNHGPNLGVKADWGATLNGSVEGFEYEVGWSRGTGNEYTDRGDPGIVAGRVGTDRDADTVVGLSGLSGRVLGPNGTVDRDRVGLDLSHYRGPLGYLAEFSLGDDEGRDVRNAMVEMNWRNSNETVLCWLQARDFAFETPAGDFDDGISSALGIRWAPDPHWSLSFQWTQAITTASPSAARDALLALQLRYRF